MLWEVYIDNTPHSAFEADSRDELLSKIADHCNNFPAPIPDIRRITASDDLQAHIYTWGQVRAFIRDLEEMVNSEPFHGYNDARIGG